ncbi:MAG: hypothetical protein HN348_21970, partial [Proteobacteria bacterium]|nr:hypothetical protein [Pseudomonadota bacterium]
MRRYLPTLLWAFLACFLLSVIVDAEEPSMEPKHLTIEMAELTLIAGEGNSIEVTVKPKNGFKWNKSAGKARLHVSASKSSG